MDGIGMIGYRAVMDCDLLPGKSSLTRHRRLSCCIRQIVAPVARVALMGARRDTSAVGLA
jgi:hypothetical protein